MVSNDYKPGENKFTGKIVRVTVNTAPSNLNAADQKAVEHGQDVAAAIVQ
jgi:arylsulfatase